MERTKKPKSRKRALCLVVISNLAILVALKYLNLFVYTYNAIAQRIQEYPVYLPVIRFMIPIGISFYTLSILSYVFDVYYELIPAENNVLKLSAFAIYFPLMISGPIVRYSKFRETFFEKHPFDYQNVTWGMQRILWGFFKVLVISERLNPFISTVYNDYQTYPGIYIVVAAVCFSFQLYANFSGSMDIVLGISETFGIVLPENFSTPFFSKSIQEFWRRWHITLGLWLKDYIFYPLLRTAFFMNLPKKLKGRWGKKKAKQITTFAAMFILWFSVGLWHGGAWKYIIGSGILPWFYIVTGEMMEPVWNRLKKWFHITAQTKWFSFVQMLRTFLLMTFAFLFFQSNSLSASIQMIKSIITTWNPQILWDGSLLALGLKMEDWIITAVSLLILLAASVMQQKKSVRSWLKEKNIILRWGLLYMMLFYVILLGNYGPGYSAAEFIYQGF